MNPAKLKPGDQVRMRGNPNAPVFVYVCRGGRNSSRFTCDRYKGQDGPDDPGFVYVPDWEMSRKYELVRRADTSEKAA